MVFSVPKAKGYHLEPLLMRLDRDSRWFVPTNERVAPELTNYGLVVATVKSFARLVKRKEIDEALAGRMDKSTITRNLDAAVSRGELKNPKYGHYETPEDAQPPEDPGF